jgi:hypothetical protein
MVLERPQFEEDKNEGFSIARSSQFILMCVHYMTFFFHLFQFFDALLPSKKSL